MKKAVLIRGWFLCSSAGKRQQGDVARLLDGRVQAPLVWGANTGQPPRNNFAAFRHELRQQPDVLVINGLNLLHAELANFLAPEILAAALAPARAARSARTGRTPLSPIGTLWALCGRNGFGGRCCCWSGFVSHDAPSCSKLWSYGHPRP